MAAPDFSVKNPVSPPFFSGAPYGDGMEVSGFPQVNIVEDLPRTFMFTDARSVMIVLQPHHSNFIPNPSCRRDMHGWKLEDGLAQVAGAVSYQIEVDDDAAANLQKIDDITGDEEGQLLLAIRTAIIDGAPVETARYYLISDKSAVTPPADIPFPIASDLSEWRAATPYELTDKDDSWVGRSICVSGSGVLRYRDSDGTFVYVGNDGKEENRWHYDPTRGSAQWTFSAFFKGRGKFRMVMEAYLPTDPNVPKSPPLYQDLDMVQVPTEAPYDPSRPFIQDETATVWALEDPPYYTKVTRPVVSQTSPGSLPGQTDEFLLDAAGHLWRAITPMPDQGPKYEDLGVPVEVDSEPEAVPPVDDWVVVRTPDPGDPSQDGFVWQKKGAPYYRSTGNQTYLGRIATEWIDADHEGDDWKRYYVQTGTRWVQENYDEMDEQGENPYRFFGSAWIDARIEFQEADGMKVSSLMLDPAEYPVCSYFDGDMVEDPAQDDYMWQGDPNDSVSLYYIGRKERGEWLWTNLRHLVPVSRPYQIFYGRYDRPHRPSDSYHSPPVVDPTYRSLTL